MTITMSDLSMTLLFVEHSQNSSLYNSKYNRISTITNTFTRTKRSLERDMNRFGYKFLVFI